jgi:hypothetical protein
MPSMLTTLIQQRVTASAVTTIGRSIERVAEELAEDILRDPVFREEIRALAKAAFAQTLRELRATAPPDA